MKLLVLVALFFASGIQCQDAKKGSWLESIYEDPLKKLDVLKSIFPSRKDDSLKDDAVSESEKQAGDGKLSDSADHVNEDAKEANAGEEYVNGWKKLKRVFVNKLDPPTAMNLWFQQDGPGDDIDFGVLESGAKKALDCYLGNHLYGIRVDNQERTETISISSGQIPRVEITGKDHKVEMSGEFLEEREQFLAKYKELSDHKERSQYFCVSSQFCSCFFSDFCE
eukprot:352900_1